jgi:hypothetical protein
VGDDRTRDIGQDDVRDERLTVADAAEWLGITKEAVRKRISRGTLRSDKGPDGTVHVYIPPSGTASETIGRDELVDLLRAQLEDVRADRDAWRDQARRSDYMAIAAMDRTLELESRIRELEAPSTKEATEAAETVEEATEGTAPRFTTGETREGTERPQQRSGWLAPVDSLPWWQYMPGVLGVFIINFFGPIMIYYAASVLGRYGLTLRVAVIAIVVLAWAPSGFFGLWVGFKLRHAGGSGRSWPRTISRGLVIGIGSTLGLFSGWILKGVLIGAWQRFSNPLDDVWPLLSFFLGTTILYISGELIGNARRRRREKALGEVPARSVSQNVWSPRSQAMLGFAGTIIAAMISLAGTVITNVWGGG